MMPLGLPPNPELAEWATRHGLDPSRIPVREFDVRSAATREHPRQVRVDYVALLLDEGGSIVGRDARTLLTCDPPPSWLHPATPEQERAIAARALREFADSHVHHQSPARMQEDLRARADEIEAGR